MTNVYISWDDTVDPQACNTDETNFDNFSRDPARTPFQWDGSPNAGFSESTETWLPVSEDYRTNNVLMQSRAPTSHLQVFKKLVKVRQEPSFQQGALVKKVIGDNILVYKRQKAGSDAYVVVLNFGAQNQTINLTQQFPGFGNNGEVITASTQSIYNDGDIVNSTTFMAQANVGIVVVSL